MADKVLNVYVNEVSMGVFDATNDIWSFEYDEAWVNNPEAFALSPKIPLALGKSMDGSSERPVQHFFDNLLPEENARELLAKDLDVQDVEDSFELLDKSGKETAGALTIAHEVVTFPEREATLLTNEELCQRIEDLPQSPLNNNKQKRMSLAGAQHKMLVIFKDESLYEPNFSMPSTHILKPDHSRPEEYWQSTMNEWFIMKLAKAVGIDVPEVYIRYTPLPIYLIKRFDRQGEYPAHNRIHIIDACQLLGLGKGRKYKASSVETYQDIVDLTRGKGLALQGIYRWTLFNLLIGNGDAHLKNISFYQTHQGTELAPFYDLLSTLIYGDPHHILAQRLSVPIGTKTRFEEVNYKDIEEFAKSLGLPPKIMQRITSHMMANIDSEFQALYDEVKATPVRIQKAGELRMLRQIRHLVLKPMLVQLSIG